MREHSINGQYDFIQGYYADDLSICDRLVEYHKNSPTKAPGTRGVSRTVDVTRKDSTDCILEHSLESDDYTDTLARCVEVYGKKYVYAASQGKPWSLVEWIQLQHYLPGQGYHAWHHERTSCELPFASRHLVFMTYLNDVTEGGETEFFYQKLKIKPEKGLTLIWPADWTFTHKGVVSNTQEKYIATGWFNYIQ